ncbi:hypothetical protein SISSUDRAFT_1060571 [Sistotremastrum suecicum HHB10207 ss-3]|uniref:Chromatin remodeling complex protein n=1 Tax=Sistotremastrum suecicum HHB10207 ss-3 TaxID=1314776 RepID=A0A166EXL9_9AGAM|nr:hypothetical protein SISSUDRAFT_1060571 [Sistotremastrum suecicum HHB10207 ss-3]
MPTCRRKRVLITQPSDELLNASKNDPTREVFYLAQTGEIFPDYESYTARMSFYRTKQFQCEVTGKGGLDYFHALESELQEARTLHERFPESLKAAVLQSVQWQIMGRLDHLVEAVYDRFKDRYFEGEKVFVDIQGDKFWARVAHVYPPKSPSTSSSSPHPVHRIGGDLSLTLEQSIQRDDPKDYFYKIQIVEDGANWHPNGTHTNGTTTNGHHADDPSQSASVKWGGSLMDVTCTVMSRDRLAFSKSILRRFFRETVDRDPAVASPWTVKPHIAEKYGLETVMPDDVRKGVEIVRKGEIEKRKKIWDEKEGPPSKKQKKNADIKAKKEEEERAREIAEQEQKEREAQAALLAKKKKKPLKYPTEDLDVVPSERERRQGLKVRPLPKKDLPFGISFEPFLMTWGYLQTFGVPLHLSPFSLDDYERAILHSQVDNPCFLIAEIHTCLIYNLRQVQGHRHSAIVSLSEMKQEMEARGIPDMDDVSIDALTDALIDKGNSWERNPLRASETRDGWHDSMIGCLKDHATVRKFPRLRAVLTHLLFPPADAQIDVGSDSSSHDLYTPATLYPSMPVDDKIALLAFLCDVSISSKSVHAYMDNCEEQLTQLRKDKIELNRERKRLQELMAELAGKDEDTKDSPKEVPKEPPKETGKGKKADKKAKAEPEPEPAESGEDEIGDALDDVDSLSDEEAVPTLDSDELGSDDGAGGDSRRSSLSVRPKSQAKQRGSAQQRKLERQKAAKDKAALAEYRRADEELNKLDRKLEVIELDFRKLLGSIRAKPIGKDRFYSRVWWFDGFGGTSLVAPGGGTLYGAGRLFIQGPSQLDWEAMDRRDSEDGDVMVRMREELGEEGVMDIGEWGMYTEVEEVEEFIKWLNHKGRREASLKNALTPWLDHIFNGMRKRLVDVAAANLAALPAPEGRRSSRKSAAVLEAELRQSYMGWTNKRAPNSGSASVQ